MANENEFMLHALLMGIFITFVYDILRIFRRVIPHKMFFVSLEDFGFWIYCAGKVFLLMYRESNGKLRWFAVLSALAGMVLYQKLVSPRFVKYVSFVLQKTIAAVGRVVGILLRPLVFLFGKLKRWAAKIARRCMVKREKYREPGRTGLKNKLTHCRKMFKIKLWTK